MFRFESQTGDLPFAIILSAKIFGQTEVTIISKPYPSYLHFCSFFIQFWDELAEIAASHLKREDHIFVAGSIWVDSYLGSDNVQKTTCKVHHNI